MNYIGNALSLGMLDCLSSGDLNLHVSLISIDQAKDWLHSNEWTSCVGHVDTAALLTSLLGCDIPAQRTSTSLEIGDQLLVAQYNGPRLPEGAVTLPDSAKIRYILVKVCENRL
jgi:hypothetical protein